MGIKKAAKKAGKASKKASKAVSKEASSADKTVSKAASSVGKAITGSEAWKEARGAANRISKGTAHFGKDAQALAKDAENLAGKFDDMAAALADKIFRETLEKLAKQIFKDNRGMFDDAKKVAQGLQEAKELTKDFENLANDLKNNAISDADATKEANRLARASGLAELAN